MILLNIINDIPLPFIIIIGLFLGAVIGELDWRYSPFWDEVRPRKKKDQK